MCYIEYANPAELHVSAGLDLDHLDHLSTDDLSHVRRYFTTGVHGGTSPPRKSKEGRFCQLSDAFDDRGSTFPLINCFLNDGIP